MNDENNQSEATIETVPVLEQTPTPVEPNVQRFESIVEIYPTEQIDLVNPEPPQSDSPQPAPALPTPQAPQTQSLAQQDEHGFIKSLLIKAQAKIQFNKQKKLEKIIRLDKRKE